MLLTFWYGWRWHAGLNPVQATKMLNVLEHITCEETLKDLGLFSLKMKRLWKVLPTVCSCLMGDHREDVTWAVLLDIRAVFASFLPWRGFMYFSRLSRNMKLLSLETLKTQLERWHDQIQPTSSRGSCWVPFRVSCSLNYSLSLWPVSGWGGLVSYWDPSEGLAVVQDWPGTKRALWCCSDTQVHRTIALAGCPVCSISQCGSISGSKSFTLIKKVTKCRQQ